MHQMTISYRDDEAAVIEKLMAALNLKRHQVIKLAIRHFLFPTETSNIPLDGAYAEITGIKHLDDVHRRFTITKENGKKFEILKRVE